MRSGLRSRETSAVRSPPRRPGGTSVASASSTRAATVRVVIVWASAALAGAAGLLLVALRVVNDGMEPEGRNWWLAAEIAIGIGFLPAGTLLLSYPRRRLLGASFVAVGLTQLIAALACEWEAYAASVDDTRVAAPGRWEVIETIGLIVLTAVVPWFLPWRTRRGPQDPLKLWLAFGVARFARRHVVRGDGARGSPGRRCRRPADVAGRGSVPHARSHRRCGAR